jgi:formylglycine-generating enzyme required for sulfatase activity
VDLSKPAGTPGTDNCCTSNEVAAGMYYRTYTNTGSGPTGEADLATVSGFRLDKYEVTVGRYRQFVTAWNGGAGYTPPAGSGKHTHLNGGNGLNATAGGYETGWVASDDSNMTAPEVSSGGTVTSTWTASPGSNEDLPINFVNWYDAYAFCIWDGGFLPSEAEWGYAAAGGMQQYEYPWGAIDPGTANLYAIYNCDYPSGSGNCLGASITNLANVGTAAMGPGLFGQLDLAGSVQEWTLDWYAVSYVNPCMDCANLTAASDRSTRGGAFTSSLADISPELRNGVLIPARLNLSVGFRCARTP